MSIPRRSPSTGREEVGPRQAVLYTRVSSKDQERGGFSIPAQRKILRRYARERGINVTAEFNDVQTAGRAGRAEFGEMIRHLKTHRICKAILVEKTDRLYRNLKDWVTLDDLGVEVHMVKESVVLSRDSVSSEKFVHGIKVLVAKNYLDNLSEEVRKGLNEKVQQGHWPARAPIGYLNIEGPDGKRVIGSDPVLGPLITRVFEWYATDAWSLTEVTEMARSAGLVTRKTGSPVPRSMVHSILRNPFYMGEFDWNGARYEAAHEPLVEREVWDRVQDILTGRAPRRRKKRPRRQFTFSGLIHCGVCADEGKSFLLVAEMKKGRYVYYRCEECKRRRRATYVREERIVESFAAALEQVKPSDELVSVLETCLFDERTEAHDDQKRELVVIKTELSALEDLLSMAYEDRLAGRIDAPLFDRKATGWRSRMDELQQEIEERRPLDVNPRTDEALALELGQLVEIFRESSNTSQRRRIVEDLHSNSVWRDGELDIHWKTA